jgi:very-short-patch-repair endonuclease
MQSHNKDLARALRHNLTRSEKELWRQLRNRKLGGLKFRRQQPLESYILDFFCADKRLVVELDGGQHDIPEEREYDEKRTAFLNTQGLEVLRFWNSQIRENLPWVLELIRRKAGVSPTCEPETPHPDPLPQGERE